MLKKDLYKKIISFSLAIICGLVLTSNTNISAEEVKKQPLKAIVEVNDLNSAQTIKEVIINNNTNYNLYPFLIDNIDYSNSTINVENFDVTKIGTHSAIATVTIKTINPLDDKQLFEKVITGNIIIEVVDTIAPVITLKTDSVALNFNQSFDPNAYIDTLSDNHNSDNIILQIASDVDATIPGDYLVTYTAIDACSNSVTVDMNVNVKEEVTYTNIGDNSDQITKMFNLINEHRAANSLSAFELGSADAQTAVGVRACESIGDVSHDRPDGSHYKTAFDDYGVEYSNPYEILTYAGSTVESKLNWWKSSTSHNGYLLKPNSTKIAIGYCDSMWAAIIYE